MLTCFLPSVHKERSVVMHGPTQSQQLLMSEVPVQIREHLAILFLVARGVLVWVVFQDRGDVSSLELCEPPLAVHRDGLLVDPFHQQRIEDTWDGVPIEGIWSSFCF